MAVKPYCYDCRKTVRSPIEHRATATHRATLRGPAQSSLASRPPRSGPRTSNPADVKAWSDAMWMHEYEQSLATLPPSIDDVFPVEIMDPIPAPLPAERGHTPLPCERCGRTFRTDAGATWHRMNNPHCERWAKKRAA